MGEPAWALTACHHIDNAGRCWVADCLRPGCLWTDTADTPDDADTAAELHQLDDHRDEE